MCVCVCMYMCVCVVSVSVCTCECINVSSCFSVYIVGVRQFMITNEIV